MHAELACSLESFAIAERQRDAEAARVFEHTQIRAQGDVVIVRRRLAMDAVGADVLEQVRVHLVHGKLEQRALGIELRDASVAMKRAYELEGAVIALGGERAPHVAHLALDALDQPVGERRVQPAETWRRGETQPGVDPVQDAPRRDVAAVAIGRYLVDPRPDQALPGVEVCRIVRFVPGVGEVEAVIELGPFDAPLGISRQARVQPIRLETVDVVLDQFGDARDGGTDDGQAARHSLGQNIRDAIAVAVGDDAARQAQNRRSAVLVEQVALAQRASQAHVAFELEARDLGTDLVRVAPLGGWATGQRAVRRARRVSSAPVSPTITASNGTPRRRRMAHASTRTSKPFLGTSRPTLRMRRHVSGGPSGRGGALASRSVKSTFRPW